MRRAYQRVVVTPPAVEPVSVAEAKLHLRVDVADDDALIGALVQAGREVVESRTGRALITQTWDVFWDGWPAGDVMELPLPPLQSVTSVTYFDTEGTEATLGTASYWVDTSSTPGRVVLYDGSTWPSTALRASNGVKVRMTAGYGTAGTATPARLRAAVNLLAGHWYENREAVVVTGAQAVELPFAVKALTDAMRVTW